MMHPVPRFIVCGAPVSDVISKSQAEMPGSFLFLAGNFEGLQEIEFITILIETPMQGVTVCRSDLAKE